MQLTDSIFIGEAHYAVHIPADSDRRINNYKMIIKGANHALDRIWDIIDLDCNMFERSRMLDEDSRVQMLRHNCRIITDLNRATMESLSMMYGFGADEQLYATSETAEGSFVHISKKISDFARLAAQEKGEPLVIGCPSDYAILPDPTNPLSLTTTLCNWAAEAAYRWGMVRG